MHAYYACVLCMRIMHAYYACVLCMRAEADQEETQRFEEDPPLEEEPPAKKQKMEPLEATHFPTKAFNKN